MDRKILETELQKYKLLYDNEKEHVKTLEAIIMRLLDLLEISKPSNSPSYTKGSKPGSDFPFDFGEVICRR